MSKFQSIKTYGTDRGLSCGFRQWRANHSHCSTVHGYSLGFEFVWESEELDDKNWCFDFGNMKPIKNWLDHMFDHTYLIAEDDPALEEFKKLQRFSTIPEFNGKDPTTEYYFNEGRVIKLRILPHVGCEMIAKLTFDTANNFLQKMKSGELGRYPVNSSVSLKSVKVFEHGANSATYYG